MTAFSVLTRAPLSRGSRRLPAALLLATTLVAGCFPYFGPSGYDTSTETETPAPPQLTDAHPGWQLPNCLMCHDYDRHNESLDPYQCARCHDSNGAPAGHGGTPPCLNCHGEGGVLDVTSSHGTTGFPDPDSCETCHPSE